MDNREYVILDIETSHFNPEKGGMIIDVGAIIIDSEGRELGRFNELIDPERRISGEIINLTGIKNEDLIGKRTYHKVLPDLYSFLGERVIVGHGVQFDWDRFLLYFFKKLGIYPQNKTLDTLAVSKAVFQDEKKFNLGYLSQKLGIDHRNKHRAMGDVLATKELFLYLKEQTNIESFIKTPKAIQENNSQISLFNTTFSNENKKEVSIRNISIWDKTVAKNKRLKRIYVTLDTGVVFYDLNHSSWQVKNSLSFIDFNEIEKAVIKKYQLSNIKEVEKLFD